MKILITGADVNFNETNSVYDVLYNGVNVFSDKTRSNAIMFGLSIDKLRSAIANNSVRIT